MKRGLLVVFLVAVAFGAARLSVWTYNNPVTDGYVMGVGFFEIFFAILAGASLIFAVRKLPISPVGS